MHHFIGSIKEKSSLEEIPCQQGSQYGLGALVMKLIKRCPGASGAIRIGADFSLLINHVICHLLIFFAHSINHPVAHTLFLPNPDPPPK